jgi:hypothetical protein
MGSIKTPGFGRKGLVHKVVDYMETPFKTHAFDDEVSPHSTIHMSWG